MYVRFKKIKDNIKVRKGVGLIWSGIGIFGTITGSIFGYRLIRDEIWKPKKRIFESYDEDVIKQTSEYMEASVKQGIELDYDETLNKLQELKNINKISKKDD